MQDIFGTVRCKARCISYRGVSIHNKRGAIIQYQFGLGVTNHIDIFSTGGKRMCR